MFASIKRTFPVSSVAVATPVCTVVEQQTPPVEVPPAPPQQEAKPQPKVQYVLRRPTYRNGVCGACKRPFVDFIFRGVKHPTTWYKRCFKCAGKMVADGIAVHEAKQPQPEAPAANGTTHEPCYACGGSKVFVYPPDHPHVPNRQGKCFSCAGKGWQDENDKKRDANNSRRRS